MRTTQKMSITLPNIMVAQVKAKVRTGEYATESEVIREGLRALQARERAIENWLQNVVCPVYDAVKADPANVYTFDDVRASIKAKRAKANEL